MCVELVCLMDVGHHLFGEESVGHPGHTPCGLDLVDDPVPVAHAFQGDRCSFWELCQVIPNCSWFVVDTLFLPEPSLIVQHGEEGIVFVGIATYAIM